jgi:hypothetical protein
LFGQLKNRLQREQFGSADELVSGVRKILDEISADILEEIFQEWIKRLDRCIAVWQQMESIWDETNKGRLGYS